MANYVPGSLNLAPNSPKYITNYSYRLFFAVKDIYLKLKFQNIQIK